MAIIEEHESQFGLTKQRSSQTDDELCFTAPLTFKSMGSSPSTDPIIIDDDEVETLDSNNKQTDTPAIKSLVSLPSTDVIIIDDEETLEPKNKETDTPASNTLGSSVPSTDAIIIDEEETLEPEKKKRRLGSWWDYDEAINELSAVVKGFPKAKENDAASTPESCLSSTDLHEKKKDDERSLSSIHQNFTDLSEDESVGARRNKGDGHVSLEELGVSVEDLKNMPWEAFDPTWEIRSETMDPWLGGYVKDMLALH